MLPATQAAGMAQNVTARPLCEAQSITALITVFKGHKLTLSEAKGNFHMTAIFVPYIIQRKIPDRI
jgi:hypothetical protein